MPTGPAAVVDALQRVLDDRARREADVRPGQVVGRGTDGRALVMGLDGECVTSTGAGGYDGEIVHELPALTNKFGTAGAGNLSRRSTATLLWVDSITPSTFGRGTTVSVAVVGKGFTPTTVFQFLLPASETVHPGITINYSVYTNSELVTLNVTVAADAELVTEAPLAFDDPALRF